MNIIIVGKMGAGKTFVAQHLCDNYNFQSLAIAGPIKDIEKNLDTMTNNELYFNYIDKYVQYDPIEQAVIFKIFDNARKIPRENPKPRKRLQYIGTDGFRKLVDPDIWIKITHAKAQELNDIGISNIVIDDVRFLNEYQFFVNKGWYPIKLIVDLNNQINRLNKLYPEFDSAVLQHPSELEQDEIFKTHDGVLINTNIPKQGVLKLIDAFFI
jgi:hypothetical protein